MKKEGKGINNKMLQLGLKDKIKNAGRPNDIRNNKNGRVGERKKKVTERKKVKGRDGIRRKIGLTKKKKITNYE